MSKLENILEKNNLEEGYKFLTKREKKIISLYYLEGYTDEEIGRLYGVCQQVINRLRRNGDYADFAAQDAAIEGVMDTIISKNIFHNNGNDLVAKVNARILDYRSTDVMDV